MKKNTLKRIKSAVMIGILILGLVVPSTEVKAWWYYLSDSNDATPGTVFNPYVFGRNVIGVKSDGTLTVSTTNDQLRNDLSVFGDLPDNKIADLTFESQSFHFNDLVICDGIEQIGKGAFYHSHILNASIPASVTTIDEYAFGGYSEFSKITIADGNNPLTIGEYAFANCPALCNVSLPNRITIISKGLFLNCPGLKEITLPSSVTSISNEAFKQTGLKSITIPNSVTSIGSEAFNGCWNLTTVTFEETSGSTSIDTTAFSSCSKLKNIVIKKANDANEIKTLLTKMATSTGTSIDDFSSITVPEEYVSAIRAAYPSAAVISLNPPVESVTEAKASEGTPEGPSKSVYEEKMDSLIKDISTAATDAKKSANGKKTVYLKDVTSLSLSAMKALKSNPSVNLDMTYTYKGIGFHIVIPGNAAVFDESIPWYGPLWLYARYGQGAASNTVNTLTNIYIVQSGDTLRKIAAKYSISLEELLLKNPQIKDKDKISIGDKINI